MGRLIVPAAVVLVYAASCTWWPFAKCWCCHGRGVHARRDGKVFRPCRVCKGTARRLRLGRKAWNHYAKARKKATAK